MQFEASPGVINAGLKEIIPRIKDWFPIHNERKSAEIHLNEALGEKTPLTVKSITDEGHSFHSESREMELILSTELFNFKRYSNYTTWESFKEEALTTWEKCVLSINPIKIKRLSLRYINNIEIDKGDDDAKINPADYFNTNISFEKPLQPPSLSNYKIRYTIPLIEEKITIHVSNNVEISVNDKYPFLIDIDVLYNDVVDYNYDDVKKKLDELRDIKNYYFFNNLTPKGLKLIT